MKPPIPFDENDVKKFWPDEDFDKNLPAPGFITDFVLRYRGIRTPTKLQVWTALFMISSVLKRDTWLKWDPLEHFANIFVFMVAPPAICAKSTAARIGDIKILSEFHKKLPLGILRPKKKIRVVRTKATGEGLQRFLAPRSLTYQTKDGSREVYDAGSDCSFIIPELGTFLSKKKYNMGLITDLTDLYDCSPCGDSITSTRNYKDLKDIYVTIIGGTTPKSLEESIPEEAFGDGFLSRVMIVYQPVPTRTWHRPIVVQGGPTECDLQKRLAWIAENSMGEYDFAPEVDLAYKHWCDQLMLGFSEESSIKTKATYRYDEHLRKLALLIRVQRYEPGKLIMMQDFLDAKKILEATFSNSYLATQNVGIDRFQKSFNTIKSYLRRLRKVTRKKLLQDHSSRGINSGVMQIILRELYQMDKITIINEGKIAKFVTTSGKEIYKWNGPAEERYLKQTE